MTQIILTKIPMKGATMPKNKSWFRMEKKSDDLAEIEIFDEIDSFFGMGPKEFKAQFDTIKDAKKIKLLINSPGGDVFDGAAIYNMLSTVRGKLEVEVIGLAASMASIIALAGSKLTMAVGSYYMIHNPWAFTGGDAVGLRKIADLLDKMKTDDIAIYSKKSGLPEKEIASMMDDETWLTADEAIEKGFADDSVDYGEIAARATPAILAKFGKVPAPIAKASEKNKVTTPRELEGILRDAGYSRTEAVAIVASGIKGLDQGEPAPSAQGEPEKKSLITPAMLIAEMDLSFK